MRRWFFCRIVLRAKDFSKRLDLVKKITGFCRMASTHTAPESDVGDVVFGPLEIPSEMQTNDLPSQAAFLRHVSNEGMWDDTPRASWMIIWYLSFVRGRGNV